MATILIIDDDPDIVTAVRMTLEQAGHTIKDAKNGEAGIKVLKSSPVDMIILDVMMDTPTEGFELAQELHNQDPKSRYAEFKDTPILLLTSVQSKTPLLGEIDLDYLPVEMYVDKPIDPDDLVTKVDWILNREEA